MDDHDAAEATTPETKEETEGKKEKETKKETESERSDVGIAIELTSGQVDRVIRDATGAGNMSILLSGQSGIKKTLAHDPKLLHSPKISVSLLRGLQVLAGLPPDGDYIGVTELARELNESASTTHRYLATLQMVGLVERDPTTRKYRLAR
jgi:hypothetical protein